MLLVVVVVLVVIDVVHQIKKMSLYHSVLPVVGKHIIFDGNMPDSLFFVSSLAMIKKNIYSSSVQNYSYNFSGQRNVHHA